MSLSRPGRPLALAAVALATALSAAGCASSPASPDPVDGGQADAQYPVTVDNCGEDLVIESRPERVLILSSTSLGLIEAVDGLDQVVARTGTLADFWSPEVRTAMEDVPVLAPSTGQTAVSREAVAEVQPDLVIGYESETVNRENLGALGIPLYILPSFCAEPPQDVTFEMAFDNVETFGRILGHPDEASVSIAELRDVLAGLQAESATGLVGAAVFPDASGRVLTYGGASMINAQLIALGLANPFADQPKRYFETSVEALVEADPDVIVVLYSEGGTDASARETLSNLPGAGALSAIDAGRVATVEVSLTDPPNPYSIEGLQHLRSQLDAMDLGGEG